MSGGNPLLARQLLHELTAYEAYNKLVTDKYRSDYQRRYANVMKEAQE